MKKKLFTVAATITLSLSFILGACSKESSTTSTDGKKNFVMQ